MLESTWVCWAIRTYRPIRRFIGRLSLAPEDHLIGREYTDLSRLNILPARPYQGRRWGWAGSLGALCTATDWLEAPLAAFGCFHSPSLLCFLAFAFALGFRALTPTVSFAALAILFVISSLISPRKTSLENANSLSPPLGFRNQL